MEQGDVEAAVSRGPRQPDVVLAVAGDEDERRGAPAEHDADPPLVLRARAERRPQRGRRSLRLLDPEEAAEPFDDACSEIAARAASGASAGL